MRAQATGSRGTAVPGAHKTKARHACWVISTMLTHLLHSGGEACTHDAAAEAQAVPRGVANVLRLPGRHVSALMHAAKQANMKYAGVCTSSGSGRGGTGALQCHHLTVTSGTATQQIRCISLTCRSTGRSADGRPLHHTPPRRAIESGGRWHPGGERTGGASL